MKSEQDYIRDIAAMRSMMERTSKFLSLSGLAGIMAGIYALSGAYIAYKVFDFNPVELTYNIDPTQLSYILLLALVVLFFALGTATILSYRNAQKAGEKIWNPTARRLLINMSVALTAGGIFALILITHGLLGLIAPATLIFYGLALYNASKFTYEEIRSLGIIQIILGLAGAYFIPYGLLFWALGFGVFHIAYGVYMHYRYER